MPGRALLEEDELPVVVAQRGQVAVVGDVEEVLARALVGRAGDVVELVVPVEVHLVRRAGQVGARLEPVGDVGVAGGGEQRDEPVVVADDAVEHGARPGCARASAPWPAPGRRPPSSSSSRCGTASCRRRARCSCADRCRWST